jgi:hypothetical protein
MGKGVAAVLVLAAVVVGDAPARADAPPEQPEPELVIRPCCLRTSEYRPRTQFVTSMLRSVEDL